MKTKLILALPGTGTTWWSALFNLAPNTMSYHDALVDWPIDTPEHYENRIFVDTGAAGLITQGLLTIPSDWEVWILDVACPLPVVEDAGLHAIRMASLSNYVAAFRQYVGSNNVIPYDAINDEIQIANIYERITGAKACICKIEEFTRAWIFTNPIHRPPSWAASLLL